MCCNTKSEIDVQGHRGCRGLLPENSLLAFEKAIDLGVHTLELDLVITKDKHAIVSHEPFMSRTICLDPYGNVIPESDDKKYNLYQMTHEQIKQFDCGTRRHDRFPKQENIKVYKPLLKEVFALAEVKHPNIKYNIEIKSRPSYDLEFTPIPAEFVSIVLAEIKDAGVFDRVNLQSFDLRTLEAIKTQAPKMKVALLVDDSEDIWHKLTLLSYKPDIVSPYYKLLDAKIVRNLKAEYFQVIPWTVNQLEDMQLMLGYDVDGIITDYPDVLQDMLLR
ncbi:MAG: glycerophosphodiester phosphodiesterase [Flavobacteriaceae bacterium]|nr:glycerophosphodiester phosphodiesterase [Flavobacteriaceae bacterium]